MPRRTTPLVAGQYYHVYNRGVARQPVFLTKRDYERFLLTVSYYSLLKPAIKLSYFLRLTNKEQARAIEEDAAGENTVELISFVLMPNHFHLLVRQSADEGISIFFSRVLNSYTRYFNAKHDRVGPLFQGAFKVVRVETDAQLIHLSRYIHLNPLTSYVTKESVWLFYPWSSLADFRKGTSTLCDLKPVLSHFASPKAYEQFVRDQADYAKRLGRIKHLTLERE